MERKAIALCELLSEVKTALKNVLPYSWWIIAEISEIKVNYSGHCYLELIEKNEEEESVKAKARATIWSSVYRMIQPYFETTTQMPLSAGLKIMVKVSAEFHELYGFSLNITDIEPSYTIGELARQKLEIINRLKAEGVFDMNKSLILPDIPSHIAVISSSTAAGKGDFFDQLIHNRYGYKFFIKLFPAVMQGEEAEQSIIDALDRVNDYGDFFDVVVIIRGGGSQSDLNCFNNYWLNYHICQFPIPVLTGIGHEQDETIADLVAHTRLKTPTAVAEYLIGCFSEVDEKIRERSDQLYNLVNQLIREEKERLDRMVMVLRPAVKQRIESNKHHLELYEIRLNHKVNQRIQKQSAELESKIIKLKSSLKDFLSAENHQLSLLEKQTNYLDPALILKRGYSITYYQGKALKKSSQIKSGETIETKLGEGTISSKTL